MISFGSGDPTRAIGSTLIAQAFQSVHYPVLPGVEYRRGSNRKLSRLCRRDLAYPRSTRLRCVAFSHRQTDDRKRIQFQNIEMELIAGRRTATVLSGAV